MCQRNTRWNMYANNLISIEFGTMLLLLMVHIYVVFLLMVSEFKAPAGQNHRMACETL